MNALAPQRPSDSFAPKPGAEEFLLRLAEALHTYGTAADRLEEALARCALALGVGDAQFHAGPTSIFVAFGRGIGQRPYLLRVDAGEIELGKLGELFEVWSSVEEGTLDPHQGLERIQSISDAAPRYSTLWNVIGFGLASASAARFFGSGWRESLLSFALGATIGVLARLLAGRSQAKRLFEPVAAFLAAFVSLTVAHFVPLSDSVVTLSALIVLIPGLSVTVAVSELATRHLVSGTARLAGALTVLMTITFGVALGRELGAMMFATPPLAELDLAVPEWTEWVAVAVTPLAFTLLLQARFRSFFWILLTGLIGYLGSKFGSEHLGPQLGAFTGALLVGLASNLYGRVFRRPAAVVRVPGILLLVPGSIGYRALSFFLVQDVLSGMEAAFRMGIVAVALVGGLLAANVLLPTRRSL